MQFQMYVVSNVIMTQVDDDTNISKSTVDSHVNFNNVKANNPLDLISNCSNAW